MERFFNLYTVVMLVGIAIVMIAAVFSPTINWLAVIWMVIAAMWVVIARLNEVTSDGWKQLYSDAVDELVGLRGKHQALDSEYLKLAKHNEATSKENAQLLERVEDLRKQHDDTVAKYKTDDAQDSGKKPRRRKKLDLSDEDVTRIKMEMRTAGLIKDEE